MRGSKLIIAVNKDEEAPLVKISDYAIVDDLLDRRKALGGFWKDFRENFKPIYEEFKKAGFITDYKVFTNPEVDHPHDWDVAVAVMYPNWAALDQLDAKGASIATKHYGTREAMIEAGKKRADLREIVASHLAREVTPK